MRIQFFMRYYGAYHQSFYFRNPDVAALPYDEHLDRVLDDLLTWPGLVMRRLREAGHEAEFVLVNARPLQYAWASEHGVRFGSDWLLHVGLEQVRAFRPDALIVGSLFHHKGAYMQELRELCGAMFAWIASPHPPDLDVSVFDCILTSHRNFAREFRAAGTPAEILLPSFEPRILDRVGRVKRDVPLSFVGGITSAHERRRRIVKALVARTPIEIWGYGELKPWRVTGVRSALRRIWATYSSPGLNSRHRGAAWGKDMYRVLCRSLMTLNVHGEVAGGLAGNMRMFEATGAGALLLTESAPNLGDMFEPDKEVVTYRHVDELIDKIEYYLEHPSERERIAAAGQHRALTQHTTAKRGAEIVRIMERYR